MDAPLNRVYIAVSLDGFVATADGGVAWLDAYQSEDYGYDAFIAAIETIVMGRATFDQVIGFGDWPYEGKKSLVITSQPPDRLPVETQAHSEGVPDLIETLRTRETGGIWIMGGASLIRAFLDHDAVDMMELFVMPRLLGNGVRLFDHLSHEHSLTLASAHPYPSGVVKLTYTLQRDDKADG